jgi:peptidyl-prolyl cis-trans isomerase C
MYRTIQSATLIAAFALAASASAQSQTKEQPLVSWKSGSIFTKEIEADILKLPAGEREDTLKDPRVLLQIIDNLQVYRELAARAKAEKKVTPEIELSAAIAAERHIGLLYLSDTLAKFRQSMGDLTPAAREQFDLNKSKYVRPEEVNIAHILIAPKNRTDAQAKQLAENLREQLVKGADFGATARTHSDDGGSKDSAGVLGRVPRGALVKPVEDAAFKLQTKGELSPVTQSQFGYHIILLNSRKSAGASTFEEVKDEIIEEIATKAVGRHRDTLISGIRNDPTLKINEKRFEEYTGARPTRKAP